MTKSRQTAEGISTSTRSCDPHLLISPLPKVHIVIINWNGLADTQECLDSLERITYSNVSVIVVDNASREDEAAALQLYSPTATVLKVEKNLGFAGGNNVGFQYALSAGADYILCLNNDTIVAPDFLEPLVQALEQDPRAGLAVSKIFFWDPPDKVWFLGGKCEFNQQAILSGLPARHGNDPALEWLTEPFKTDFATGCVLLARADVIKRLNGFDERYFTYCEDVDLSLRTEKLGMHTLSVPRSHVWHKISRSSGGHESPSILYYCVRNTWLLTQAHAPGGPDGAKTYYQAYARQQKQYYTAEVWMGDPSAIGRATARLSALWCVHLGLYGRRQDHRIIEKIASMHIAFMQIPHKLLNWLRLGPGAMRVYWFLNAHLFSRLKKN